MVAHEVVERDRVLIVEDQQIVARDLADVLTSLGYEIVDMVATGDAAIRTALATRPDVILMDIRLAGRIDGVQAAERIRAEYDVPVVYLTAHSDPETLRRATATMPFGYLTKPFKSTDLRCAIEIALHRHEIDAKLREREQWLTTTLAHASDVATVAVSNPIAEALAGWSPTGALRQTLDEIRHVVTQADTSTAPTTPPGRVNATLEREVVQRTRELQAANLELDAFRRMIEQDLRAPLRGIDGFSQALIEDHAAHLGPEALDHLRRVRAAADRISELVENLLRLSRVATLPLNRERLDLAPVAFTVLEAIRARDRRPVDARIQPALIVEADRNLIQVALQSLIDNAWKFCADVPAPKIEIGHAADGAIYIRDNGVGFPSEVVEHLFTAFHRRHDGPSLRGNGIGLATTELIIHRHGGRIWAEGEPGRGATFSFTL